MAINESSRLHASLRKENVPVHRLIVNQLLPQSESDCKFCSIRRKVSTNSLQAKVTETFDFNSVSV